MHLAHQEANKKAYENIDPKSSEVYRLANQLRGENTVGCGGKPVKNDAGGDVSEQRPKAEGLVMSTTDGFSIEFDWDPDYLSDDPPAEGLPIPITSDVVLRKLSLK